MPRSLGHWSGWRKYCGHFRCLSVHGFHACLNGRLSCKLDRRHASHLAAFSAVQLDLFSHPWFPACNLTITSCLRTGFQNDPILWVQAAKELGARHAWPNNSIWLVAVGWLRGGAKAGDNYEGRKYRSGAEWSAALMAVFHLRRA